MEEKEIIILLDKSLREMYMAFGNWNIEEHIKYSKFQIDLKKRFVKKLKKLKKRGGHNGR